MNINNYLVILLIKVYSINTIKIPWVFMDCCHSFDNQTFLYLELTDPASSDHDVPHHLTHRCGLVE